jgi:hypothetical protein
MLVNYPAVWASASALLKNPGEGSVGGTVLEKLCAVDLLQLMGSSTPEKRLQASSNWSCRLTSRVAGLGLRVRMW